MSFAIIHGESQLVGQFICWVEPFTSIIFLPSSKQWTYRERRVATIVGCCALSFFCLNGLSKSLFAYCTCTECLASNVFSTAGWWSWLKSFLWSWYVWNICRTAAAPNLLKKDHKNLDLTLNINFTIRRKPRSVRLTSHCKIKLWYKIFKSMHINPLWEDILQGSIHPVYTCFNKWCNIKIKNTSTGSGNFLCNSGLIGI